MAMLLATMVAATSFNPELLGHLNGNPGLKDFLQTDHGADILGQLGVSIDGSVLSLEQGDLTVDLDETGTIDEILDRDPDIVD